MSSSYISLLSATANTRDLGGYPALSGQYTVKNRVWRSDAPVVWNEADARLLEARNMRTLIDLRTDGETQKRPCAYADSSGFDYRRFPITAGSAPPPTLEDVPASYLQIAMQPETAATLRLIAEADTGVLLFCTAGKDRTGVVSALLLLACGVDRATVIADYAVSREYNRERLEKYLFEHPDVDRRTVLANEISMDRFIGLLLDQYGSIAGYFAQVGLGLETLERIRQKLLIG